MPQAELEISLFRGDLDRFLVELRYSQADCDTYSRHLRGRTAVSFDLAELKSLENDDLAYGCALARHLFADDEVWDAFHGIRVTLEKEGNPLRVRLFIGPSAVELQALYWEKLCDPKAGVPLFCGHRHYLSRFLGGFDWRPIQPRARSDLKALVMIANPKNLADYQLSPLDISAERERVIHGLVDIPVTLLDQPGQASKANLIENLREHPDILYLVAHGKLRRGVPYLFLEDEQAMMVPISGEDLLESFQDLNQLPRLALLVSCQSAGDGSASASALAPRLAQAGIPAVLAMQGNISMVSMAKFLPIFFEELQKDGLIDRAVAVARAAIRDQSDWWMPVLYLRLKSGRIWYNPGFTEGNRSLEKWPALLRHIKRGRCTPILGPTLSEHLVGSRREIARHWAERFRFPMTTYQRDDLTQVAQFLTVKQDAMFPFDELSENLERELERRHGNKLNKDDPLEEKLAAVGGWFRQNDPHDPFRILADLPLPMYLTAAPDHLLEYALQAAGRDSRSELCRWNDHLVDAPSLYDDEPDFRPSAAQPLVYRLFGELDDMDSLVLTEDNYFDFLIGVTSNKDLIPTAVRRALSDSALLFLGFNLGDWDFRVLFRGLMTRLGGDRRRKYAHVAAQIDPEADHTIDPTTARQYLENYFGDADISIYWGSARDFLAELSRQLGGVVHEAG